MTSWETLKRSLGAAAAVVAFIAVAGTEASAQEFDCRDAQKKAEKVICDSGKLSALDERMSELYDDLMRAYSSKHERAGLRRYQRDFLEVRNACRGDRDCIKGAYLDQISVLEDRLERATRRSER